MKTFERFLKYVMFETMSDESSQTVPSTPGQKVLGQALVDEIKDFGIEDVYMNEKGYVYGSVPSNIEKDVPVIGFIAHVDTADAHPSPKITPRIIEKYDGSVIQLICAMLLVVILSLLTEQLCWVEMIKQAWQKL